MLPWWPIKLSWAALVCRPIIYGRSYFIHYFKNKMGVSSTLVYRCLKVFHFCLVTKNKWRVCGLTSTFTGRRPVIYIFKSLTVLTHGLNHSWFFLLGLSLIRMSRTKSSKLLKWSCCEDLTKYKKTSLLKTVTALR